MILKNVEKKEKNTALFQVESDAAEFESVSVTTAVALSAFCESVAECDAVFESHNADRTCFRLSIKIPAVIGIVI